MKKIYPLMVGLIAFCFTVQAQVQRKVMIEHFTNASCPPCAFQNPGFNDLLSQNPDIIVPLKYQAPFPGFDPMNVDNPGEVATRSQYYGLSGVPTVWIDGILPDNSYANGAGDWNITPQSGYAGGPYGYNQAVLDYAASQTTPIAMSITNQFSDDMDSMDIRIVVTNMGADDFALGDGRLHIAIMEDQIVFPEAPGSTDERIFQEPMRKMYPNATGTALGTIAPGDSAVIEYTVDVPDYVWDYREVEVVSFVQDNVGKYIWQAERSGEVTLPENAGDAAAGAGTPDLGDGICGNGNAFEPNIIITNNSDTEMTSAMVGVAIGGQDPVFEEWTGSLMKGESATVSFEVDPIYFGFNATYGVISVNGIQDYYRRDNFTAAGARGILPPEAEATDLDRGFETESTGAFPARVLVEAANGTNTWRVVDRTVGSFNGAGGSRKGITLDFYNWNPASAGVADEAYMTFEKVDLTNSENSYLSFDRAGAQYDGSTKDRIQVLVSTDCGENWDIVHDIAGADFATADPTSREYYPAREDWVSDTINLFAYDGKEEVIVQFKAISGFGNNHFLDNINLSSGLTIVSTESVDLLNGQVNVFPNPTSGLANIEFEMKQSTKASVEVFDATGRSISLLAAQQTFVAGRHNLSWNAPDKGIYLIRITTEHGDEVSRKLTVH